MPAEFTPTAFPEVVLITPKIYSDSRGCFFESFKGSEFLAQGLESEFVQENYSFSKSQVIRGLHYQRPPKAQIKLVRVVSGAIWDVVVDVRPDSPTFGTWHAETLSEENCKQLYIPAGFAHGFKVTSETATVLYRTNAEYAPDLEGGVAWNDPSIGVPWDLADPLISARDNELPPLKRVLDQGGLDCFRQEASPQTPLSD